MVSTFPLAKRLIAAAVLLLAGAAPAPSAAADDPAAANRKASADYDSGLRVNPGFRNNREHLECDSIESLDLRARCIASFDQAAPPPAPEPPASAAPDLEHPTVTITNRPVRSPGDE